MASVRLASSAALRWIRFWVGSRRCGGDGALISPSRTMPAFDGGGFLSNVPGMLAFPRVVVTLGVLLAAAPAAAQSDPTPAAPSASAAEAPAEEETDEADQAENAAEGLAELRRLEKRTQLSPELLTTARRLRAVVATLDDRASEAIKRCRSASSQAELDDLEHSWLREQARLAPWKSQVDAEAKQLKTADERATGIIESLSARQKALTDEAADAVVLKDLADALTEAKKTRRQLRERKSAVLRLQSHVVEAKSLVDSVLEAVEQNRPNLLSSFRRTAQPLWKQVPDAKDLGGYAPRLREAGFAAGQFATSAIGAIVLHVLLAPALFTSLLLRRRRVDPKGEPAVSAVMRPASATLLCFAVATLLFYPVPALVKAALQVLALGTALRHLDVRLLPTLRYLTPVGFLVLALDIARRVAPTASVEAWLFAVELLLALVAISVSLARAAGAGKTTRRLSLAVLACALLAVIVGYSALGHMLGMAVLTAAFVALVALGTTAVVAGIVKAACEAPLARRSYMIRERKELLVLWTHRILRTAALLIWLQLVMKALGVASDLKHAALDLGNAGIKAGSLNVTLADVVKLCSGIVLAIVVARLVRRVLQDDVLPRTPMVHGAQHAASTTTYYLVLTIGFFMALAAAGIAFSKLTFMVGALGVGIGFGLQNIVNNFVSGLILLFGRPVEVGDRIEVGGTFGVVERIGFRSSTLRTVQGAELIMPNAELISAQVVNWTHSDERRRIDVDIGVAYGTDPERIVELLLELAAKDERVLEDPAPAALFLNHGASSLDFQLRAWTDRFDDWVIIKSDLTRAINKALVEADIEIPFPQRDLHVRSLSEPAVTAILGAASAKK